MIQQISQFNNNQTFQQKVKLLESNDLSPIQNSTVSSFLGTKDISAQVFKANSVTFTGKKVADNLKIEDVQAARVFDSRGFPTVEVTITLKGGVKASAIVPSGASTGSREALELRDGGKEYSGKDVSKAINNVNKRIKKEIIDLDVTNQALIDGTMIKLDGTDNKSKLGANAILAVSMACARAAAEAQGIPLYEHLAKQYRYSTGNSETNYVEAAENKKVVHRYQKPKKLPVPMMNVINGGAHAPAGPDLQEFMIIPVGAKNFEEAMKMGTETFQALKKIIDQKRKDAIASGKDPREVAFATTVGDEGGFAPPVATKEALGMIRQAIQDAGYEGKIKMGLDSASSEFYKEEDNKYHLEKEGLVLTSEEMVDYYKDLKKDFPEIISIEDGMAEKDWDGWKLLTKEMGKTTQIVGDDLYVTNPSILQRGIEEKATNSVLIKLNQIGTVSETLDAIRMADNAGFTAVVSHRSGETEDPFIADLVVGTNAGQIKTGSLCRTDRMAKYNQLLRIERELNERSGEPIFPLPEGKLKTTYPGLKIFAKAYSTQAAGLQEAD